jgi:hypothetical protein
MNTSNPLPYSISDVMLSRSCGVQYIDQRKSLVSKYLEERATEFQQIFGIHLVFFVEPITGFDYSKFADVIIGSVPNGVSEYTATASRYGTRASELISELINAFNNTKQESKE